MTTIARGIPLDERTRVGFYGTDQEVLQQLHEREEGYPLSQRWTSSTLPEISAFQRGTPEFPCMKKIGLCSLGFEMQNAEAKSNSLSRIVVEE